MCLCLCPYPRIVDKKSKVKELCDKLLLKHKNKEEGWSSGKLVLAKEVEASLSIGVDIKKKVGAFRISWC